MQPLGHARGGFAHHDLLVVAVVAGEHDDRFEAEAVNFCAEFFEPGPEQMVVPVVLAFDLDRRRLIQAAHAVVERRVDDAAAFFSGAHAEGVGFQRVEAEGVVLAVPFDGAQREITDG